MWCCLNQIQFFTKFISCYYNVIHVQVDSSDILNISLSFAVAVSSSNQLLQDTVLTPVVAAMAGTGTGTGTASGRRSLLAAFNATSTSVQAAKIAKVQQLNIAAAAANIAALVCVGGGAGGRSHGSTAWRGVCTVRSTKHDNKAAEQYVAKTTLQYVAKNVTMHFKNVTMHFKNSPICAVVCQQAKKCSLPFHSAQPVQSAQPVCM